MWYIVIMKLLLHSSAILLIVVASGCQSGRSVVVDQRPDYIPLEQIESTICIKVGKARGSAVILDSTHLLTCSHVFGQEKTREVSLLGISTSSGKVDQFKSDFHLVDDGGYDDADSVLTVDMDPESDWALIKTEKPNWDAKNAAVIHPAAVDPEWVVPEGTELFLVGYSPIFMEDTDPGMTGFALFASSDYEKRMLFIKNGPYTLCGKAAIFLGHSGVLHSENWPVPAGHSGGGVYLWNADAERLELVGIFTTGVKDTKTFDVVVLPRFRYGETLVSFYSPIAPVLQALKTDKE
jgi:hypothetical protein